MADISFSNQKENDDGPFQRDSDARPFGEKQEDPEQSPYFNRSPVHARKNSDGSKLHNGKRDAARAMAVNKIQELMKDFEKELAKRSGHESEKGAISVC